ncbi:hypothetical protein [Streptomyces sp. 891-h]|uniref:hypothetical protein n=1 Tax=Streptomyces sp. 891-h TaxID=2720714 RepID=UPI001FAA2C98|nr:hypothetical protein [Streptomyces sp. 891-h]UNZ21301.1 hypothetical protein HC362_33755 [Streptomyces sp. 891-h]
MDYYGGPDPASREDTSLWALTETAEEDWQYPVVGVAGALLLHSGRRTSGISYPRACRLLGSVPPRQGGYALWGMYGIDRDTGATERRTAVTTYLRHTQAVLSRWRAGDQDADLLTVPTRGRGSDGEMLFVVRGWPVPLVPCPGLNPAASPEHRLTDRTPLPF